MKNIDNGMQNKDNKIKYTYGTKYAASIKGVTLLELLISIMVLAIGIFTIMNIFPTGFSASLKGKNRLIALQLAQKKMDEIKEEFKRSSAYCISADLACCPVLRLGSAYGANVDASCNPTIPREIQFPAPNNGYYYKFNATPIVAPEPQRTITATDSWWSTWDSTSYMVEVEVFGPVDNPSQFSSSPTAVKTVLISIATRDIENARFPMPSDPHAQEILTCPLPPDCPSYRIPAQIHLKGAVTTVDNPQH